LADVGAVAPLFDAYRQFYEQPTNLALAQHFLAERQARAEALLWVAEQAQGSGAPQALGFTQCYPSFCSLSAEPVLILSDLFVSPAGRRSGVARALLQATEDGARQLGFTRLDLTTAHTNRAAQALYESMGWTLDTVYRAYNRTLLPTPGA
jgi:ribosomal protein S18 acetylase RimI-like enzyme